MKRQALPVQRRRLPAMRQTSAFGITAALCVVFAAYGVSMFLLGPCLTAVAKTYGVSLAAVGSLFGALAVGFLPAALAMPAIAQRLGRKATLAAGLGVVAVAMALFAVAPEIGPRPRFGFAVAAMAIMGVGAASIEVMANAIASDANPGRQAFVLNLVHAFFSVGAVAGPWLAAVMLSRAIGWQLTYGIAAAVLALAMVALLPQRYPEAGAGGSDPFAAFRMLRIGAVAMGLVGIILYVSTEVGLSGWIPAFMEKTLHTDKPTAAASVSILWAAMTVGRFACTALAQRFPAALFVVVLSTGTALASIGVALSRSVFTCYLAAGFAGLCMSSIFAMVLADVGVHVRGRAPMAFSIVVVGVGGGMLFFPPAMGWIGQATGSLRLALGAPALLMIACAATYAVAHMRRGLKERPY